MLLIGLCSFAALPGQPPGYYDAAGGKSGIALQQALHDIIDDHTVISYSGLLSAFYTTDARDDGTVWDMYSDNPGGENPYEYSFGTDQCGNYSAEGDCYNREHSFPRSWFGGDVSPMYTDLFHLYPTDGKVNGMRGNYPFGETETPSWTSLNGSRLGPCSTDGYTGTVFEPIDEYKGDFARTYFYMATRYLGEDAGWPGSPAVDGAQLKPWALDMMRSWGEEDPVSQKEIDRNNAVFAYQGNRNPFIDHPEYIDLIYNAGIPDETAPGIDSIVVVNSGLIVLWFDEQLDSLSAIVQENYSVSGGVEVVQASVADENIMQVELELEGIENGNYVLTVNGVADTAGNALHLAIFYFEVKGLGAGYSPGSFRIGPYPNPSRGTFFIEDENLYGLPVNLSMKNLSGQPVPLSTASRGDRIRVSARPSPGMYVLDVCLPDGRVSSFKVVFY